MKIKSSVLVIGLFVSLSLGSASALALPREVLGLRLGMSKEAVHIRLKKIGSLEREERGRQEVWTLTGDVHYRAALVGYDRDYKVRYITALAREDGRRVRYSDVARIEDAQAENAIGHYKYTWAAKPGKKSQGYFLIVMGRDPQYLSSLSIKREGR